jgi:hypothetical protein
MKDNEDKLSVLEQVDERLGEVLSAGLQEIGDVTDQCPSPENIAALVEGRLSSYKRDEIMKHISSCDTCCETFILAAQLHKEAVSREQIPGQRRLIFFKPLALAASILIVIVSLYLFFKTDLPQTSEQLLRMKEATPGQEVSKSHPTISMETDFKDNEKEEEKKPETPPTSAKYSMPKVKIGSPPVLKKESSIVVEEGRLEEKKSKKISKADVFRRRDHFRKADETIEKRSEEKSGRILGKKSSSKEVRDESPESKKNLDNISIAQQKTAKSPSKSPEKLTAEIEAGRGEQKGQIREKRLTFSEEADIRKKEFVKLQKNKAWSQASLFNQQSQVYKADIPAKDLEDLFGNTIDIIKQLKREYEALRKKAETTGDYTGLNAFILGVSPLITIKTDKEAHSISPNIAYFLSMSAPGSAEYQFFNLARSGWCEPKVGCFDMEKSKERNLSKKAAQAVSRDKDESMDQLRQWKYLQPRLMGVFHEVAQFTIENIQKQQRSVPAEK